MKQAGHVRVVVDGPGNQPLIEVGGVDISAELTSVAMALNAASPLPRIQFEAAPGSTFEFEGLAGVTVVRAPSPLDQLVKSIDRAELRKLVDRSGFAEHPADVVLGVILRMAEEIADVQRSPQGSPEAVQRSGGDYSRGSGPNLD